jgi:hypothetical protein
LNVCGRWKVTNLVLMGQSMLIVLSVQPMHSMVNPMASFSANFVEESVLAIVDLKTYPHCLSGVAKEGNWTASDDVESESLRNGAAPGTGAGELASFPTTYY